MQILKKHKILVVLFLVFIITGGTLFTNQIIKTQGTDNINQAQYRNAVAGLLRNKSGGSNFVVYDTKNWNYTVLLKLPDVSPDNYCAISSDGNYIAYTIWDKQNARRYLKIYSVSDGKVKSFYKDMPVKYEIKKISWLPDNKTLLFITNDANISSYQEIKTLNVVTGRENILVKGEVWRIRVVEDTGTTAQNFYLKGHKSYLKVKEKKSVASYGTDKPINSNIEWNYYLNQKDINEIYKYYGGSGTFDINNILDMMYVDFSAPRCSKDGTKIIYSATLKRTSAPGEKTPLWMCSAIWEYDIKTCQMSIVYSQTDSAAIGRVDWIDNDEISYISFYDFQGSRDTVNYFNVSTKKSRVLFPYSDVNYNNVTLLPVGNRMITFTTSKKDTPYENSSIILFNVDSNKYSKLDVKFGDDSVLLENFIFIELHCKSFPR